MLTLNKIRDKLIKIKNSMITTSSIIVYEEIEKLIESIDIEIEHLKREEE